MSYCLQWEGRSLWIWSETRGWSLLILFIQVNGVCSIIESSVIMWRFNIQEFARAWAPWHTEHYSTLFALIVATVSFVKQRSRSYSDGCLANGKDVSGFWVWRRTAQYFSNLHFVYHLVSPSVIVRIPNSWSLGLKSVSCTVAAISDALTSVIILQRWVDNVVEHQYCTSYFLILSKPTTNGQVGKVHTA